MPGLTVRVARETEEVPAAAWAELTACSPASITGSLEWYEAALETVDRDAQPYILTVQDGEDVVALLTLVLKQHGREPTLKFAAAPFNDLTDLMVLPQYRATASAVVLRFLAKLAEEGWTLELEDVDPGGSLAAADGRLKMLRWEQSWPAPTLHLGPGHASLVSRKRRRLWDKTMRGLNARGKVEIRFVSGLAMVQELSDFIRVRAIRLRAKGRNLSDPPLELLEAAVRKLAPLGHCAFMDLRVDNAVVARDLYLLDGSVAMLWLRALDMNWLPYSCGHLLLRASASQLAAKGFKTLDFGRGGEPYKLAFGAQERVLLTARAPNSQ
jgi:CelD/BcsL family acetyltransferase involved in cellulose biosynthesis